MRETWAAAFVLSLAMSCLMAACSAAGATGYSLQPAFDGRDFDMPVELLALPEGGYLIADQSGRVSELDDAGHEIATVLDLSDVVARDHVEEGLLSLALDPDFAQNGHLWAYTVLPEPRRSAVIRFTVGAGEPLDGLVVLEVPQPFGNHNGGALRFGPDGMLYLGLGDGGGAYDPAGNGANMATLLSKIIRIDVSSAHEDEPYGVPVDNPFVATFGARPEIWAVGLRNPWRMAFDPVDGTLWAADVGQDAEEEVSIILPGRDYGWSRMEGTKCLSHGCDPSGIELPVAVYPHGPGCSITGGVVSRGGDLHALDGSFLFADFCTGKISAVDQSGAVAEVVTHDGAITGFGTGHGGHVFVLQAGGPILRLVRV